MSACSRLSWPRPLGRWDLCRPSGDSSGDPHLSPSWGSQSQLLTKRLEIGKGELPPSLPPEQSWPGIFCHCNFPKGKSTCAGRAPQLCDL